MTKRAQLVALMGLGNWRAALSMAAKFADLGAQEVAIRRGHEAMQRPDFQRQLGRNPEAQIAAGIEALKARYMA